MYIIGNLHTDKVAKTPLDVFCRLQECVRIGEHNLGITMYRDRDLSKTLTTFTFIQKFYIHEDYAIGSIEYSDLDLHQSPNICKLKENGGFEVRWCFEQSVSRTPYIGYVVYQKNKLYDTPIYALFASREETTEIQYRESTIGKVSIFTSFFEIHGTRLLNIHCIRLRFPDEKEFPIIDKPTKVVDINIRRIQITSLDSIRDKLRKPGIQNE